MRSRAVLAAVLAMMLSQGGNAAAGEGLWGVYEQALKGAKYVDLTHTITPKIPVWAGFRRPRSRLPRPARTSKATR
jgi:hypothetical protein